MKILHGIIIVVLFLFAGAIAVSAHTGGPPYVLINGEYVQTNPLTANTTSFRFPVGSDLATPSGYLINTPIIFDIDEDFFPNPYSTAIGPLGGVVASKEKVRALFRWDFGDGSAKKEGKQIAHSYTKAGTYIVNQEVKYVGKTDDFASVNTVQVTVEPSKTYELPQAIIRVNGKRIDNPLRDTVDIQPATSITFDASLSTGKIKEYKWDFGESRGADGKEVKQKFGRGEFFPFAVLRVVDENGIVHDTYAQLDLPLPPSNPVASFWYAIMDFIRGLFSKG